MGKNTGVRVRSKEKYVIIKAMERGVNRNVRVLLQILTNYKKIF